MSARICVRCGVPMEVIRVPCPDEEVIGKYLSAFDALLAVAMAAGSQVDPSDELWEAYRALDAQHPGWREWSA